MQRALLNNAEVVDVLAKEWIWKRSGYQGERSMKLPTSAGASIQLGMISQDVPRSFYVPISRSTGQVLPGRYLRSGSDRRGGHLSPLLAKYGELTARRARLDHHRFSWPIATPAPGMVQHHLFIGEPLRKQQRWLFALTMTDYVNRGCNLSSGSRSRLQNRRIPATISREIGF